MCDQRAPSVTIKSSTRALLSFLFLPLLSRLVISSTLTYLAISFFLRRFNRTDSYRFLRSSLLKFVPRYPRLILPVSSNVSKVVRVNKMHQQFRKKRRRKRKRRGWRVNSVEGKRGERMRRVLSSWPHLDHFLPRISWPEESCLHASSRYSDDMSQQSYNRKKFRDK